MNKTPFYSQSVGKHTLLLVSFLILSIASFFAMFTTYSNYVIYVVLVIWVPFLLKLVGVLSKNEHTFVRVSFLFFMVILIYWLIGYSSIVTVELLRNINWIMTGVITVYALKLFSEHELSIVYVVLTIEIIVLSCLFISSGRIMLAMGEQNEAADVASTWHGSLFMLLSGLSWIVFLHMKSWFPRIVSLVVLLLSLYLNFFILQRGIIVFFTTIELGMILVLVLKRKYLVYFLLIVIAFSAVFIYTSGMLIDMFDWLADNTSSHRLAVRYREISNALYFEDINASSGSLSARTRLIGISWDTFTSNIGYFVFGAGEHSNNNNIIGHHSFFIDTLARYGIIGGVLMIVYFKKQYQIIMSVLSKKREWSLYMQCAVVFLFYVLRNIFGGITTGVSSLIIMAFFPMTFQIIQYNKNK